MDGAGLGRLGAAPRTAAVVLTGSLPLAAFVAAALAGTSSTWGGDDDGAASVDGSESDYGTPIHDASTHPSSGPGREGRESRRAEDRGVEAAYLAARPDWVARDSF